MMYIRRTYNRAAELVCAASLPDICIVDQLRTEVCCCAYVLAATCCCMHVSLEAVGPLCIDGMCVWCCRSWRCRGAV
jgi:hypothetical protein